MSEEKDEETTRITAIVVVVMMWVFWFAAIIPLVKYVDEPISLHPSTYEGTAFLWTAGWTGTIYVLYSLWIYFKIIRKKKGGEK